MSAPKHTPAPWRPVNRRDGTASVLRVDEVVAYIPKGWPKPEREANARLIAAAPDLLAFAKELLRHDGEQGSEDYHALKVYDARERLRAAIAAAEAQP